MCTTWPSSMPFSRISFTASRVQIIRAITFTWTQINSNFQSDISEELPVNWILRQTCFSKHWSRQWAELKRSRGQRCWRRCPRRRTFPWFWKTCQVFLPPFEDRTWSPPDFLFRLSASRKAPDYIKYTCSLWKYDWQMIKIQIYTETHSDLVNISSATDDF